MQSITVHVPDDRVADFYVHFGEFLASEATSEPEKPLVSAAGLTIPAWVHDDEAPVIAAQLWNALSDSVRGVFRVLIAGALEADTPRRFTPADLAEHAGVAHGGRGIAGMLGAAGNAIRKLGLPTYEIRKGDTWHCVWHWSHGLYSMDPEVAELLRPHI